MTAVYGSGVMAPSSAAMLCFSKVPNYSARTACRSCSSLNLEPAASSYSCPCTFGTGPLTGSTPATTPF